MTPSRALIKSGRERESSERILPYGPYIDRYYRYKLAEKLSERLDEMGKDLTSMIDEVNGASATLSKTNRADEPVCSTFNSSYYWVIIDLHPYRSLRLCAFSTRTSPSSRLLTRALLSCKLRFLLRKKLASRFLLASVTVTLARALVEETQRTTSTALTWDDDKYGLAGCLMTRFVLIRSTSDDGACKSGRMGFYLVRTSRELLNAEKIRYLHALSMSISHYLGLRCLC